MLNILCRMTARTLTRSICLTPNIVVLAKIAFVCESKKKRNTSKYLALIDTDRILCCENALRFDGWTKSHSFTCASALKSIPNYLTSMRRWEYEHKPGSRTSDTKTHMRTRFDITLSQSGVPGREFTLKVRRPEPLI